MNKLILVSDIWGKTPEFVALSEQLKTSLCRNKKLSSDCKLELVSPYDLLQFNEFAKFDNEQQAYEYFIKHIGLHSYSEQLKQVVAAQTELVTVVAFSVGGSALWQISEDLDIATKVAKAFCFYSSQVRHSLELEPKFPVTYIAPKSEQHFEIGSVVDSLTNKSQVDVIEAEYLHGFMNACSDNFNKDATEQFIVRLTKDLR